MMNEGRIEKMIFNEMNILSVLSRELDLKSQTKIGLSPLPISSGKTSNIGVPFNPIVYEFVIDRPNESNSLTGRIYKDVDAATAYYVKVIREWLSNGEFLGKVNSEPGVYMELMKVANTRGLRSFLETVYSAGMVSHPQECLLFKLGSEKTRLSKDEKIVNSSPKEKNLFRQKFANELEERLLYWLCRYYQDDPEKIIAVILDQCTFIDDELELAIIRGFGGWVNLAEYTITAETDEGFAFEPTSEATESFMRELFKSQQRAEESREIPL